jgi:hypothetical protein
MSANISNNNNSSGEKSTKTGSASSGGSDQPVTSSAAGPEAPVDRPLRVASTNGWDAASASISASAPPSCGSGGSVDDEWSRQMDELDRLRPSTAEPTSCGSGLNSGRSVIDFFSDLPDVIIDDDPVIDQLTKSNGVSIEMYSSYRIREDFRRFVVL